MTSALVSGHVQGWMPQFEICGYPRHSQAVERFALRDKAEILIWLQNYQVGTNTLVECDFVKGLGEERGGPSPTVFADMLSAATGLTYTAEDLNLASERFWNLVRLINLREGVSREDDDLPYRCQGESLPDSPAEGRKLTGEGLGHMLDDNYRLRGWDAAGVPTRIKLAELVLLREEHDQGLA